jgi:hypothetical protein
MVNNKAGFGGVFTVECRDADGQLKWTEEFHNLVVNEGLQFINQQVFKGASYTATWYMGLINTGATYAGSNTMASHSGWTENTLYLQANRPTMAFTVPTSADPSVIATTTPIVFSMTGSATIAGGFITSENTKGGITGTLFSAGNFTVGDRAVVNGDTINVTYTFSADAT